MPVSKWIALAVMGLSLAGCAGGWTAPPPAGVPMAWDGNGAPPDARPAKKPRRATAAVESAPLAAVDAAAPADAHARQQADDGAAEAALKKRMVICRNCLPAEDSEIATGSIAAPPATTVAAKQEGR